MENLERAFSAVRDGGISVRKSKEYSELILKGSDCGVLRFKLNLLLTVSIAQYP